MASRKRVDLASVVKAGLEAKASRGNRRTDGMLNMSLDDIIKSRNEDKRGHVSSPKGGVQVKGKDPGGPAGRGQGNLNHGAGNSGHGGGRGGGRSGGRGSFQHRHGPAGHMHATSNHQQHRQRQRHRPQHQRDNTQARPHAHGYTDTYVSDDYDGDAAAYADFRAGYEATQGQGVTRTSAGWMQRPAMRQYGSESGRYDAQMDAGFQYPARSSGPIACTYSSLNNSNGQQYQLQDSGYLQSNSYPQLQGRRSTQVQAAYDVDDDPRYMQLDSAAYSRPDYQEPMLEDADGDVYYDGGYLEGNGYDGYEQTRVQDPYQLATRESYPLEGSSSFEDMPPITRQAVPTSQYEYEQDSLLQAPVRQQVEPMRREAAQWESTQPQPRSSRPPSLPLPRSANRAVMEAPYGHIASEPKQEVHHTPMRPSVQRLPAAKAAPAASSRQQPAPALAGRPAPQQQQPAAQLRARAVAAANTGSHAPSMQKAPGVQNAAPPARKGLTPAARNSTAATTSAAAAPRQKRIPNQHGPTANAAAASPATRQSRPQPATLPKPAAGGTAQAMRPAAAAATPTKRPATTVNRPAAATGSQPAKRKHQPIVFSVAQPAGEEDMLEGLAEEFKEEAQQAEAQPQKAVKRSQTDTAPSARRPVAAAVHVAATTAEHEYSPGGGNEEDEDDDDEYEPGGDTEQLAVGPSDPRQRSSTAAAAAGPQDPRRGAAGGSRPAVAAGGIVGDTFFVAPPTVFRNATEATDAMLPSMKTVFRPDAGIIEQEPMSLDDVVATILACCDVLSKHAGHPVVLPLRKMLKMQQHMQAGMAFAATSDFGSNMPNAQVIIRCSQASLKDPVNMSMWTNLLEYGRDLVDSDASSKRAFAFIKHQLQHQADWASLFELAPNFYQLDVDKQGQVLMQYSLQKQQEQLQQQQLQQQEQLQQQQQQQVLALPTVGAIGHPSSSGVAAAAPETAAVGTGTQPGNDTPAAAAHQQGALQDVEAGRGQAAAAVTGDAGREQEAAHSEQAAALPPSQQGPAGGVAQQQEQAQHTAVLMPKQEPGNDA